MRKQTLWVRGGAAAAILLVGWVFYVATKQIERNRRIEAEVATLQAEADRIKRENESFSERIQYFSSPDFQEQEAKKKLGLKKVDETVVVIKPEPLLAESVLAAQVLPTQNLTSAELPNYQKWWLRFTARP